MQMSAALRCVIFAYIHPFRWLVGRWVGSLITRGTPGAWELEFGWEGEVERQWET
jgi:hypothetical protein